MQKIRSQNYSRQNTRHQHQWQCQYYYYYSNNNYNTNWIILHTTTTDTITTTINITNKHYFNLLDLLYKPSKSSSPLILPHLINQLGHITITIDSSNLFKRCTQCVTFINQPFNVFPHNKSPWILELYILRSSEFPCWFPSSYTILILIPQAWESPWTGTEYSRSAGNKLSNSRRRGLCSTNRGAATTSSSSISYSRHYCNTPDHLLNPIHSPLYLWKLVQVKVLCIINSFPGMVLKFRTTFWIVFLVWFP